jgi:hypothetical protein
MRVRAAAVGFVLLFLLSACTPAARPVVSESRVWPITTDRTHYTARTGPYGDEIAIASTFTAPADRDVYLLNCNGAFTTGLQRRVGDAWAEAWTASTNGCASQPILVRAGTRHSGELLIRRGSGGAPYPGTSDGELEPGQYRVVWYGVVTSPDAYASRPENELPLEQRVSDTIVIGRRE